MATATFTPSKYALDEINLFSVSYTREGHEELERTTGEKFHYINGKVFEMAGGSPEHNTIGGTIIGLLFNAVRGSRCRVMTSDTRVDIGSGSFYYPDAVVVCGEVQTAPGRVIQNPVLIVEVLSPSTAEFDRSEKLAQYQQIESLQHILYVEQNRPAIEHFERDATGTWVSRGVVTDLNQAVSFSLGDTIVTLPLSEVYERIDFPTSGF